MKTKMRGKTRQENVSVSVEGVVAGVRKMPCWKAPGGRIHLIVRAF